MFDWRKRDDWKQIIRYYQAGIINTAFGYSLFAIFVSLGVDMYLSQIISHILGVIFNYFTYSRYAFSGKQGHRMRFLASYAGNYFLSLAMLAAAAMAVRSPYIAGLISTIIVSMINYFILKRLVFSDNIT